MIIMGNMTGARLYDPVWPLCLFMLACLTTASLAAAPPRTGTAQRVELNRCIDDSDFTTEAILKCIVRAQERANIRMNKAYQDAIAGLSQKEGSKLIVSQLNWLATGIDPCLNDPGIKEVAGGSLAGIRYNRCILAQIEDRERLFKSLYPHMGEYVVTGDDRYSLMPDVSYGVYMFPSATGEVESFVASPEARKWARRFRGLTPVTPAFDKQWIATAAKDRQAFLDAQTAYLTRTHYEPVVAYAAQQTGYNLNGASLSVRQTIFSTATQHGVESAKRIVGEAIGRADKEFARSDPRHEAALINQIYHDRLAADPSSERRYLNERSEALHGLKGSGERKPAPNSAAPIRALAPAMPKPAPPAQSPPTHPQG